MYCVVCMSTGSAIEEAILEQQADLVKFFNEGDAEGLGNIYTEDAIVMPPLAGPDIAGRDSKLFLIYYIDRGSFSYKRASIWPIWNYSRKKI